MTSTPVTKPKLREKGQLMSASEIERTLVRLAHEIIEKNDGIRDLVLIGIKRRGVPIAQRLAKIIQRIEGTPLPNGVKKERVGRQRLPAILRAKAEQNYAAFPYPRFYQCSFSSHAIPAQ